MNCIVCGSPRPIWDYSIKIWVKIYYRSATTYSVALLSSLAIYSLSELGLPSTSFRRGWVAAQRRKRPLPGN